MQNKKEFMSYYIKLTRKDILRTQSVQKNFGDESKVIINSQETFL